MKKHLLFFVSILILCLSTNAQDSIYIMKSEVVLEKFKLTEVDSVIFHNLAQPQVSQDSIYIIQAGNILAKWNKTEVDSFAFHSPHQTINETVTDIDGNVYQTVTIGEQTWMTSNLRTTRYKDGEAIPIVTDNDEWSELTTPAYAWYNNDSAKYASIYGALYNWYVVETAKLCPEGWRVPYDGINPDVGDDLKELELFLGIELANWKSYNFFRGTDQGSQLAGVSALWADGDLKSDPAFGSSGFDLVPAGRRDGTNGGFFSETYSAYIWSSDERQGKGLQRFLFFLETGIERSRGSAKDYGLSVRCIKD